MSQRHTVQDATGVIAVTENGDILIEAGETVPAGGTAGYSPGALFIDTDGGSVHGNTATNNTSSSFGSALS